MALSTSFSTDTAMNYTGCHLEQIAAITAPPRLGLRFKTNAAFATNASAAAAMNSTTIARMSLLPAVESMHWERKAPLKIASRHTQQAAVMADAAKAQ